MTLIEFALSQRVKPEEVTYHDLRRLMDAHGIIQRKYDGERRTLILTQGGNYWYNKKGEMVQAPHGKPLFLQRVFTRDDYILMLDGEWMAKDGKFVVFQTVTCHNEKGTFKAYRSTATPHLDKLFDPTITAWIISPEQVNSNGVAGVEFIERLRVENREGIVIHDSYNGKAYKYKFVKQVDCEVIAVGKDGKSNLELAVYNNSGERVNVGRVSALTGDGKFVKLGDVVQVNCLYVSEGMRLVQPTKPLIRNDKFPHECKIDQLEVIIKDKVHA